MPAAAPTKTIWCLMPACLESAETFFANGKALAAHMAAVHPEVLEAKKAGKKAAAAKRKAAAAAAQALAQGAADETWVQAPSGLRFIDIGINLTDPMFTGEYRGKQKHPSDLNAVLDRGRVAGMERMIITAGSLDDAAAALELAAQHDDLYCTVGCHPTRCEEYAQAGEAVYTAALEELIAANKGTVVALGECGLDYARLEFCPKDIQLEYFRHQLVLAAKTQLPMFLHLRDAGDDFLELMRQHRPAIAGGVVHSFDGSAALAAELVALDLSIGINGCSLREASNLEVAQTIPLDRLMIETDAPWCGIKPTHAGHLHVTFHPPSKKPERFEEGLAVKNRNEPMHILQVLQVLAGVRPEPVATLADAIYRNTMAMFFPGA